MENAALFCRLQRSVRLGPNVDVKLINAVISVVELQLYDIDCKENATCSQIYPVKTKLFLLFSRYWLRLPCILYVSNTLNNPPTYNKSHLNCVTCVETNTNVQ